MSDNTLSVLDEVEQRPIHFSPIGRHTRYMLAGYLRHVLIVTSVLLAVALTIDLWPQLYVVAESQGQGVLIAMWSVLRFSALRTPDLVAPFLPFATFLGVVWTEVALTRSGERMLVLNSGRSPIQCLAPVVVLGLLLGAVEFTMDAYLGPAAMAVQMHERLGLDGQRLDRTRRGDDHWIVSPNGLLSTQIEYGPPPVLHNLTFYRRDATGQLIEVDVASLARQVPGTNRWLMRNGRYWVSQRTAAANDTSGSNFALGNPAGETMIPFSTRIVSLDLDPLWLSVFGMEVQYLPMRVLTTLAQSDLGGLPRGLYRTRLQVLYGEALLPGAMALLAASLSMLLLAYGTPSKALVVIVFIGYVAHFGTKACLLMGENGYMPPVMAGWLVPLALFATIFAVFRVIAWQRSRSGL
ncbi:MAG: LptF/LptG family permease [Alphaproteobacteria bacterium]|nr:LptF/LptG family permease [Alphaproteobacteria bacterium]MDE2267266.1 LptF/LptG family permease [Alphaproteobacteria bacterium]